MAVSSSSDGELLCVLAIFAYFYIVHMISQSSKMHWVPETAVVILVGLLSMGLMAAFHKDFLSTFDTDFFFRILLPPIIFISGFKMNLEVFYQNFTSIMVFANIGTALNAIVFAVGMYGVGCGAMSTRLSLAEAMSYGSVVSATDPVTTIAVFDRLHVEPALYTIIVAVSILDDAVSIIMFDLFNEFVDSNGTDDHSVFYYVAYCVGQLVLIFAGSVVIGIIIALAFAALVKHSKDLISNASLLHCMTLCVIYMGYLVADTLSLSGIISTLFCGMTLQRYTAFFVPSVTLQKITEVVGVVSQFFETVAFFLIGCALLQNTPHSGMDYAFIVWSLLWCVLSRAAQVYPLALLLNWYNQSSQLRLAETSPVERHSASTMGSSTHTKNNKHGARLSFGYQHVMMVAGLRGPIAFATSKLFPNDFGHQNIIAAATSVVVIATILIFGPLTEPTLQWCGMKPDENITVTDASVGIELTENVHIHSSEESLNMHKSLQNNNSTYTAVLRDVQDDDIVNMLHSTGTTFVETTNIHSSSLSHTLDAVSDAPSCMHCSALWSWMERAEHQHIAAHFLSSGTVMNEARHDVDKCDYGF